MVEPRTANDDLRPGAARLAQFVEIERRFRRSVNLDRDAGSADALDGYVVTPAVRRALDRITAGLDDPAGDRAWSLVGPYGSGKSAFAVFLADLLSPGDSAAGEAARRLLDAADGLAPPRRRLHATLLTAERAPLDALLLRSLAATVEAIWATRRGAKPKVLGTIRRLLRTADGEAGLRCATADVVACCEETLATLGAKTGAGLALIVDEAGKALEYAAQRPDRGDVYLLQALAEAAARRTGVPFVILTVLHQSFDTYAHRLGAGERNEWAKVRGRFGELPFREGGDQIIRLTAATIRRLQPPPHDPAWSRAVADAARWIAAAAGWDETRLSGRLDACWPLHPVAAALLGPLFRGRLAQNERSLFAFLSAGEPLNFLDFLRTNAPDRLYTVDRLYDYVTGTLGGGLLQGRDGRQWAAIDTAIRRLPPDADAVDERVLKTVGLLGLLGDAVGLCASSAVVAACIGDEGAAARALDRLKARSALVFRQFRDAFQIWEGSDLDLDDLVLRAGRELPRDLSVAQVLQDEAPRPPLVARRHLFETGTLRYFDVRFADAARLLAGGASESGDGDGVRGDGDGVVILALPRTAAEAEDLRAHGRRLSQPGDPDLLAETQDAAEWARGSSAPPGAGPRSARRTAGRSGAAGGRAARGGKPVVLVVPAAPERLLQVARDLVATQVVTTSTAELQSDPVARTELAGRLEALEREVAVQVERAFDPGRSAWFAVGEPMHVIAWRDVSRGLSDLCDDCYPDAPPIRNELLNRRALSTSAARARRNLIEAMIRRGDAEQLGFEGHPPEVSMYRSLLEAHGLHRRRGKAWGFGEPTEARRGGMAAGRRSCRPVWRAIEEWLAATESGRRPLVALYDRMRQPPFGLKDGPLPVLVVAALLAHADDVALYERGSFVPAWTSSLAERLLRAPDVFEVRRCRIAGVRRDVVVELASILPSQPASQPAISSR